jgi:hypothetical protein
VSNGFGSLVLAWASARYGSRSTPLNLGWKPVESEIAVYEDVVESNSDETKNARQRDLLWTWSKEDKGRTKITLNFEA